MRNYPNSLVGVWGRGEKERTYDINNHGRKDGARDRRTVVWIFCRADHGVVVTLIRYKTNIMSAFDSPFFLLDMKG